MEGRRLRKYGSCSSLLASCEVSCRSPSACDEGCTYWIRDREEEEEDVLQPRPGSHLTPDGLSPDGYAWLTVAPTGPLQLRDAPPERHERLRADNIQSRISVPTTRRPCSPTVHCTIMSAAQPFPPLSPSEAYETN
jgi:hypothetical protein